MKCIILLAFLSSCSVIQNCGDKQGKCDTITPSSEPKTPAFIRETVTDESNDNNSNDSDSGN